MACTTNTIQLPDCVTGDTWPGIPRYAVTASGTITADPLASARMFFVNQTTGAVGLQLTTAAGITINNAAAWELTVAAITPMPLAPGYYLASLELTDSAGIIRTFDQFAIAILSDPTT